VNEISEFQRFSTEVGLKKLMSRRVIGGIEQNGCMSAEVGLESVRAVEKGAPQSIRYHDTTVSGILTLQCFRDRDQSSIRQMKSAILVAIS
jgi:hypothetical protein